ncbi:MAG TPA: SUMF1/EgtB/PvdO family nonheme iron enzyme, partial [Thermoanaerobaculia bacterium]|nr:SUMF1/EgtB/PvdO family nonheme iron enzyme [Thermoanaerobaculia bacterium]
MRHHAFPGGITREGLVGWYRAARARTRQLFDLIRPEAYYDRPIALRNPIVFYEGHLPAFCVNTLVKLALKREGIDERFETLFARGIDPEDEASAKSPTDVWPSREEVQRFASACDALIEETLRTATLEDDDVPHLRNGEAVFTILEHELMHQETLLYMVHELPYSKKLCSAGRPRPAETAEGGRSHTEGGRPHTEGGRSYTVEIPPGPAILGADSVFGWDNEFPRHTVHVPAFTIDAHNVTNGEYLEYMRATGAKAPHFWMRGESEWYWRGLLAPEPLNPDAPVYVTHAEAEAYARWKGRRLPAEAEWHRAAEGTSAGNFDFASFDPISV